MKKRVLFLCTANACRSQMAEGLARHFLGDRVEAFSAGTEATVIHPLAVKVMKEIGIDISSHQSKNLSAFDGQSFDHVITLCGGAYEACPIYFGGAKKIHAGFEDPAQAGGAEEDILCAFRRVRDDIRNWLIAFFDPGKQIITKRE